MAGEEAAEVITLVGLAQMSSALPPPRTDVGLAQRPRTLSGSKVVEFR